MNTGPIPSIEEICSSARGVHTTWDELLVVVSLAFAVLGSYVALEFATAMKTAETPRRRQQAFFFGAAMMGLTIWSMHFVGMLALDLPIPVTYNGGLSAVSIFAAVMGAALAFAIMNRPTIGKFHLGIGATAMGIAIASMHYLGMAAMEMPATLCYDPVLFTLSVVIAIVASGGALAFVFVVKRFAHRLWFHSFAAVLMGGAVAGMHYVGMAAATYLPAGSVATEIIVEPTVGIFRLRDMLGTAGVLFALALLLLNARSAFERQRALDSYAELTTELERKVRERTTQLEAANQELAAFSYTVSHDLRSPLRAMSGFTQMLISDYGDRLDDRGAQYLQRILKGTHRMGELIDGLLHLSRLGRIDLAPSVVNLSALAEAVIGELRASSPERNVRVTIAPNLQARVDAGMIQSLFQNLLGNAWKFTSRNPEAEIEFGTTVVNDRETFFIRDNGVGFDMAHAKKLFGVYERLHHQDEFTGTGIGLATARRILERHGGQIWADAAVGRGATFYFTLPTL